MPQLSPGPDLPLLISPALLPLKRQELEQIESRYHAGTAWELDVYLLLAEVKRLRKTYEA